MNLYWQFKYQDIEKIFRLTDINGSVRHLLTLPFCLPCLRLSASEANCSAEIQLSGSDISESTVFLQRIKPYKLQNIYFKMSYDWNISLRA
jgi:hypothetical protein